MTALSVPRIAANRFPLGGGFLKAGLLKRIVISLVSIAVVLLVVFLVLRALFPPEVLRELAVTRLEEATGLEISVEDAGISFVNWRIGVKVYGIEVSRLDGEQHTRLATVPEIGVVVALGPLLRKEIVVEQVYVQRPDITVRLRQGPYPGADTTRVTAPRAPVGTPLRMPLLMSFSLPKAVLREGSLRLEDLQSGTLITLDRLEATSRVRGERGGEILLSEGSFSSKDVSIIPGQQLPFPIPPQEVEGSWKIRASSVDRLLDLETVSLRVSEVPLDVSGRLDFGAERPSLDVELTVERADVGRLMKFIPEEVLQRIPELKLAGDVIVSADIEGELASPDYRGSFSLVNGRGSVSGVRVRELVARGGFDKEKITVEEFAISLGGSDVRGSAVVGTLEPRVATFESAGTVKLDEISGLVPLPDGPKVKKGEVSFSARGSAVVEEMVSDPFSLELRGEASAKGVEIELPEPGLPVVVEQARLDFAGRRVDISATTARVGSSVFNIDGSIRDWKDRSLKVDVKSPSIDLKELLGPLAKVRQVDAGEGAIPGVPPVPLVSVPVNGTATLKVETLQYDYFRGEDLRAELLFGGDSLVLRELTMKTLGGKCSGRGQFLLPKEGTPSYRGSFSADKIELAELLLSFTPIKELLKGQTFFEIAVEGKLGQEVPPLNSVVATGNVRTAQASAIAGPVVSAIAQWTGLEQKDEYPLRDFATSFLVEDGRLVVPRCLLAEENSAWEFSGSTGFDGTLDHRVNVTFSKKYSEKLGSLKGLEQILKDNEGRVVLDFIVGGTVRKPTLKWDGTRMEDRAKEYLAERLRQELEKGKEKGEELREELKGDLEEKVETLKKEAAEKGKKLLEELFKKKEKKE